MKERLNNDFQFIDVGRQDPKVACREAEKPICRNLQAL